jgi:hypothetical protein
LNAAYHVLAEAFQTLFEESMDLASRAGYGTMAGWTSRMAQRTAVMGAALAVQTLAVHACSCPNLNPTLDDLIESGPEIAVFSGRVVSIVSPDPKGPTVTRIAVDDVIKGDVPRTVEMTGVTAREDRCGVDFRVGEVRTIAATKRADGRWFTSICLVPRL